MRSKGMEGFLGGPAVGSSGGGRDVRDNIQGSETGTEKAALAVIFRSVPFVTIQIPAGITRIFHIYYGLNLLPCYDYDIENSH